MRVPVCVCGIPAVAEVYPKPPGNPFQKSPRPFDPCDESDAPEFAILDRKGYPAAWLERKLDETDSWDNVSEQIDRYIKRYFNDV